MTDLDEKTEFKFDELDDRAKDRARDWYREGQLEHGWWEDTYNAAAETGKLLGIDLHEQANRTVGRVRIATPDISFSGFCSQGDGCSFGGHIWVHKMKDAVERVTDSNLMDLAKQAQSIYESAIARWTVLRLTGTEDLDELSDMRFGVENKSHNYFSSNVSPYEDDSWHDEFTEAVQEFADNFASWIYNQLEAEHDHLTSDESVDEAIRANEYIFDEFGSTI